MGEFILLITILLLTIAPLCHMVYIIITRDVYSYWKLFKCFSLFFIPIIGPLFWGYCTEYDWKLMEELADSFGKNKSRITRDEYDLLNQLYIEYATTNKSIVRSDNPVFETLEKLSSDSLPIVIKIGKNRFIEINERLYKKSFVISTYVK